MPMPQVNDRLKEAPVVVLRAVFAGIGQILLTADKVRARAAEQVWAPEKATAPGLEAAAALPLPGYDDLSLASLRARLRVLDATTVGAMLAYEKAHARREPVITMLDRRLAKLSAGSQTISAG